MITAFYPRIKIFQMTIKPRSEVLHLGTRLIPLSMDFFFIFLHIKSFLDRVIAKSLKSLRTYEERNIFAKIWNKILKPNDEIEIRGK